MFTPISLPLHLQALQPDQLPDQVPLHQQDEAGVENYPSDGQPAGEDEAEELRHEEREEDETERLEEGERSGRELGRGECWEVKCWVGVEMFQSRLLVSPALLQPLLQPNVGGGEGGKRVSYEVNVDLEITLKSNVQHLRFT